jgi:predicted metalloendopeptidase
MEPIKPWFVKIDAARDITALQQVMQKCTTFWFKFLLVSAASRIRTNRHWVLADIGASDLSLPDRDYYLKPSPASKPAKIHRAR